MTSSCIVQKWQNVDTHEVNHQGFLFPLQGLASDYDEHEPFNKGFAEALGYPVVDKASHGWASTIHAAQGSEWTSVAVWTGRMDWLRFTPSGDHTRRALYTAVSRAKETAYVYSPELYAQPQTADESA